MDEPSKTPHKYRMSVRPSPIAAARLEALPGVTTCIECAKKYPRKVDTSGIELSQASPINHNGFAPERLSKENATGKNTAFVGQEDTPSCIR